MDFSQFCPNRKTRPWESVKRMIRRDRQEKRRRQLLAKRKVPAVGSPGANVNSQCIYIDTVVLLCRQSFNARQIVYTEKISTEGEERKTSSCNCHVQILHELSYIGIIGRYHCFCCCCCCLLLFAGLISSALRRVSGSGQKRLFELHLCSPELACEVIIEVFVVPVIVPQNGVLMILISFCPVYCGDRIGKLERTDPLQSKRNCQLLSTAKSSNSSSSSSALS